MKDCPLKALFKSNMTNKDDNDPYILEKTKELAGITGSEGATKIVERIKNLYNQFEDVLRNEELTPVGDKTLRRLMKEQYMAGMDATKVFIDEQVKK